MQNTAPSAPQFRYALPIGSGTFSMNMYRPWLDETDPDEVMFASVHGYGRKELAPLLPGTGPTKSTKGEYELDTEEAATWDEDGVVEDPMHVDAENRVSTAQGEQPWVLDVGMEGTGKKSERGAGVETRVERKNFTRHQRVRTRTHHYFRRFRRAREG